MPLLPLADSDQPPTPAGAGILECRSPRYSISSDTIAATVEGCPVLATEFTFTYLDNPADYIAPPPDLGEDVRWAADESEEARRHDARRLRAWHVALLVKAGRQFSEARQMVRRAIGAGVIQLPAPLGKPAKLGRAS
jgi:hypothetical protein